MQNEVPYSGRFDGKSHLFAVRVYFEDTDAGGVVYHANYLRFMERARSDMLRVAGIDQRGALDSGQGLYVLADVTIRYKRPAKLDDDLVVVSKLQEIGGARCVIHQRVMRGGDIVTDATVTAVFVGPDGRPKRQPPAWVGIFERIKGIE
jgi:acyl-CoA thioester hydrolase